MLISLRVVPWVLAALATSGTHQVIGICSQKQMSKINQLSNLCLRLTCFVALRTTQQKGDGVSE